MLPNSLLPTIRLAVDEGISLDFGKKKVGYSPHQFADPEQLHRNPSFILPSFRFAEEEVQGSCS
jgi:hypothetical protein